MSRIAGQILTEGDMVRVGRLVPKHSSRLEIEAEYDTGEKIATFYVPSVSRFQRRVYVCQVDLLSLECACGCEGFQYRETRKSPYRREDVGHYLEHAARATFKKSFLPVILRQPSGLCPHLRRVRAYLKRNGMWKSLQTIEQHLMRRIEAA